MTEDESLLAAIHEGVNLNAYEASWPQAFDDERDRLLCLFPGVFKGVQHIGSTAVPGLSANPSSTFLRALSPSPLLNNWRCRYATPATPLLRNSTTPCKTASGSCAGKTVTGPIIFILSSMTVVSGANALNFATP